MYVLINHERNCWSKTLFCRPCLNRKPRRPEIPRGCLGPHVRLPFTWRCNNTSRKVRKMNTRRTREQYSCSVSDIFVCAFSHISQVCVSHPCKKASEHVSPYLHCCILVAHRTTLGWSSHRTTCARTFPQRATSSPRFVLRASMPHPSTDYVRRHSSQRRDPSRSNVRSSAPTETCSGSAFGPQPQPRT